MFRWGRVWGRRKRDQMEHNERVRDLHSKVTVGVSRAVSHSWAALSSCFVIPTHQGLSQKGSCYLPCFETGSQRENLKGNADSTEQSPLLWYSVLLLACSNQFLIPLCPLHPNSPPVLHKEISKALDGLPNGFFKLGKTCNTGLVTPG